MQWAVITVVTCLLLCLILRVWWLGRRLSYVYLRITTASSIELIKLYRFPTAHRQYKLVSPNAAQLTATASCVCAYLTFVGPSWYLVHTITGESLTMPTRVRIPLWQLNRYRRMFRDATCSITPMIIHSHEYVYNPRIVMNTEGGINVTSCV